MDVQDVLFLLMWLLPGLVLGVIGTILVQRLLSMRAVAESVKTYAQTKGKAKDDIDDFSTILPLELYLSTSGRVHKITHCSNMKSWQTVRLCRKCFKLA